MKLKATLLAAVSLLLAANAVADPIIFPIAPINFALPNGAVVSPATSLPAGSLATVGGNVILLATPVQPPLSRPSTPLVTVPEPATLAMFGTGLIGIATLVRHRARRASRR
jgi:hypothetical protein